MSVLLGPANPLSEIRAGTPYELADAQLVMAPYTQALCANCSDILLQCSAEFVVAAIIRCLHEVAVDDGRIATLSYVQHRLLEAGEPLLHAMMLDSNPSVVAISQALSVQSPQIRCRVQGVALNMVGAFRVAASRLKGAKNRPTLTVLRFE